MALPAVDTGYRDVPKVARAQQITLLRTAAKKRLVPKEILAFLGLQ